MLGGKTHRYGPCRIKGQIKAVPLDKLCSIFESHYRHSRLCICRESFSPEHESLYIRKQGQYPGIRIVLLGHQYQLELLLSVHFLRLSVLRSYYGNKESSVNDIVHQMIEEILILIVLREIKHQTRQRRVLDGDLSVLIFYRRPYARDDRELRHRIVRIKSQRLIVNSYLDPAFCLRCFIRRLVYLPVKSLDREHPGSHGPAVISVKEHGIILLACSVDGTCDSSAHTVLITFGLFRHDEISSAFVRKALLELLDLFQPFLTLDRLLP